MKTFYSFMFCFFVLLSYAFSQNVGISTPSPEGKLHIKGSADSSQLIVEANNTQSNTAPLFKLKNSLGNDLLWLHADDTSNVFLGLHAGNFNSISGGGTYNTLIGSNAGKFNISGAFNTATGAGALFSNTSGANNTALGSASLFSNTTGPGNTAIGSYSLPANTTGYNNTSNGYGSMFSNTEGSENTANGQEALFSNTTGSYNTAYGLHALASNIVGNSATAIGYDAMRYANNTTESFTNYNVALGYEALRGSTDPSSNIGNDNTALGYQALRSNTSGEGNTASGSGALFYNTTGFANTATGTYSLNNNSSGNHNTAIGYRAMESRTTGNYNTAIGYKADVAEDDIVNATAIGSNAYAGANNSVVIGSINGVNGATANANVGIGTTTPNASSALDIKSTTKGLLPPRMTDSQRNSIVSPVEGLLIWCTNCGIYGQLQVYNGIIWTNMIGGAPAGSLAIGDSDGGGKIAYLLQAGDPGYVAGENHGLIAAPFDQSGAQWGCYLSGIPGADGTALGTGNQNTIDIVNGCATPGIAARICNDLVLGGYSDWYLPSKDELNKLYLNRVAIGGFETYENYWSSSEFDISFAWHQGFNGGGQYYNLVGKPDTLFVRAVRGF